MFETMNNIMKIMSLIAVPILIFCLLRPHTKALVVLLWILQTIFFLTILYCLLIALFLKSVIPLLIAGLYFFTAFVYGRILRLRVLKSRE